MYYVIAVLIGYLLGCSNLAWLLAKIKGVDLSSKGSGNPGTSNAVILMGWKLGVLVGIHDIGKSIVAVLIARFLLPDMVGIEEAAGVAAVIGHIFPFYLKFKGGKGFASFVGLIIALVDIRVTLIIVALIIVITIVTDYLVVATTTTVISLPVYMAFAQYGWIPVLIVCLATCVIIFKHRKNYVRIWNRTEIGLRSTIKGEHRVK